MVIIYYKILDLSLPLAPWLWFLTTLGVDGCDRISNSHERDQPLIQQPDVQLVYERSINLNDGSGLALGKPTVFAVANEAFYVIDYLHKAVFAYDLEGQYIRTIGRRGKSEGEYLSPMKVEVGLNKKIYIYDGKTAELYEYNQAGRFVGQPFENYRRLVGKFVVDVQGSSLQLISARDQEGNQIVQQAKVTPGSESPEFSIDVSKGAMSIVFIKRFGFCYSSSRRHIYYMIPWDYKIVEVEADTGKQVRRFGIEPPSFRKLDLSSYETSSLYMADKIENLSLLINMALLDDDLLFVQFSANVTVEDVKIDPIRTFCVLYDLADPNKITVRKVKDPGNRLNYNVSIRAAGQSLYVYSPPHVSGSGINGRIDVYSLDFDRSK